MVQVLASNSFVLLSSATQLIGEWRLDETTGSIFSDSRQASVPMTIVGTWNNLTMDSMVFGLAGTSAYRGTGAAYATLPANNSAHNLATRMTLSFYYQPIGNAAKHVLFSVGDGSQVGDLSIELQTDGKLRGWHVGQDGTLRFWESSNGVTGTNLAVSTAHRIDMTFGPLGASLYLDGVFLNSAWIQPNVNGWNNSRIKYLGIFSDGAQAGADGVFDEVRLWNKQLTVAQIATLEAARSIALPQTLPLVPAMDFLASDATLPGSSLVYVYDTALGNGSGSSPANAKELGAAIAAATSGQNLIAIASTAGGASYYNRVNGITLASSGTTGSKIRLMARPGDTVVLDRGQEFATFRTPSSGLGTTWELFDSSKKIWRSVSTSFGPSFRRLGGVWKEFGTWHYLTPYKSLTDLSAPVGSSDMPTNYGGPGACVHTDSRVYIRMQRPHPAKYSVGNKWPSDGRLFGAVGQEVVGGQLAYPVTEDPRDYEIWLSLYGGVGINGNGKQHWIIGEGVNSFGYETAFGPQSGSNFEFRRSTHIYNRWFLQQSGGTISNFTINRCRMGPGSARHLSFVEFKFGQAYLESIRGCNVECSNNANVSDVTFQDCTIHNAFDLQVGGTARFKYLNCSINNIVDDGLQTAPNMSNCEIGYCYFRESAWIGFDGQQGQVLSLPWYVHHNIFDIRCVRCYNVGVAPFGVSLNNPHSPTGSNPKKIYNNTFILIPDALDQHDAGGCHMDGADNLSTVAHEVFNNIFLRLSGQVGDTTRWTQAGNFPGSADSAVNLMLTDGTSREKWDYNVYWRDPAMAPFAHGLLHYITSRHGGGFQSFATLADFRASALFGGSLIHYIDGFETHGFEFKPSMPSIDSFPASRLDYRPAPHANLTTGKTTSLSGESTASWPAQPSNWKGALDPNGTDMPVGVQNP